MVHDHPWHNVEYRAHWHLQLTVSLLIGFISGAVLISLKNVQKLDIKLRRVLFSFADYFIRRPLVDLRLPQPTPPHLVLNLPHLATFRYLPCRHSKELEAPLASLHSRSYRPHEMNELLKICVK